MIPDTVLNRGVLGAAQLGLYAFPAFVLIYNIYYLIYKQSLLASYFPAFYFSSTDQWTGPALWLHYWLGIELVFWVYYQVALSRAQRPLLHGEAMPHLRPDAAEREALLGKCLTNVEDFPTWLEGWFYGKSKVTFDVIGRENFEEWISWAFWSATRREVLEVTEYAQEMGDMIARIEKHLNITFPPSYNPGIQCVRLCTDPVKAIHRPFLFYVFIFALHQLVNMILHFWGLEHYGREAGGEWTSSFERDLKEVWGRHMDITGRIGDPERITYWYRPASGTPVVFIHGIGAGLICYIHLVYYLLRLDRPLFLVELPYVSMRLGEDVPSMQDTVSDIEHMLRSHGYQDAVFVGHSLGTAVCSWVLRHLSKYVKGVVMVDPICFLLHYHDVAFNFTCRIPRRANELIVYLLASRELGISYYISRHFHWFQTALFFPSPQPPQSNDKKPAEEYATFPPHAIPNTTVFLSEWDNLINSPRVYDYLMANGVETVLMPGLDHASFLVHPLPWMHNIIDKVRYYL
ncbi:hypothetical protein BZG36_00485 [Bifiguratus adelaidae]|uniref:AB hydrolase-1 domain-containing protein n=1 Tax=Bifiguratus adelaidae TaxID=1938954 RepID=A0A261Y750_9FUNG|nr:hypothetical protein BZG36_00485 [Bifiguratus adelaidae]